MPLPSLQPATSIKARIRDWMPWPGLIYTALQTGYSLFLAQHEIWIVELVVRRRAKRPSGALTVATAGD
jgi:hypothetical protein